jgi:hypothetical protein
MASNSTHMAKKKKDTVDAYRHFSPLSEEKVPLFPFLYNVSRELN